jgi:hypothetical protein
MWLTVLSTWLWPPEADVLLSTVTRIWSWCFRHSQIVLPLGRWHLEQQLLRYHGYHVIMVTNTLLSVIISISTTHITVFDIHVLLV